MREWRFIKQMKRAGQGHHPEGIAATEMGACAVLCPACPHPGKNLPDGWETAPPELRYKFCLCLWNVFSQMARFLYALFLAIDANFRLARRDVSSDIVDPGLNHGYAFFVEEKTYKGFLGSQERAIQEVNESYSFEALINTLSNLNLDQYMFQLQCYQSCRYKGLAWPGSYWCWDYRLRTAQFQTALLSRRLTKG
jgi:hypothetical protein